MWETIQLIYLANKEANGMRRSTAHSMVSASPTDTDQQNREQYPYYLRVWPPGSSPSRRILCKKRSRELRPEVLHSRQ